MRAKIQKISKHAPSIFQGRFDFSAKRGSFSLTIEHPVERMALRGFVGTLVLLALLYVYFIGSSVLNVIARKEALTQTASLTNAVSQLEREYFASTQSVGPEEGARLGLTSLEDTVYIHRPGNAALAGQAALLAPSNEI